MEEATNLFSEHGTLCFVIMIAVMFIASTLFLMIHDYRSYLDDHWQKNPRLTDFVRREQFYLYALLLFALLIAIEWWIWTIEG